MSKYHMIRKDLQITDSSELAAVLRENQYITLALCKDNVPYAVTLSYGYNPENQTLIMHCARRGKKYDFLQANPRVCGTVITDKGYEDGKCNHGYASVVVDGKVRELDVEESKAALIMMTGHLESAPQERQARIATLDETIARIAVLELKIEEISGRRSRIK